MRSAGNDSYRPEGSSLKVEASECGLMLPTFTTVTACTNSGRTETSGYLSFPSFDFTLAIQSGWEAVWPFL